VDSVNLRNLSSLLAGYVELLSSAWAAMANSNKRKVVAIAAFLSNVLDPSIFLDVEMHEVHGNDGPLKWVCNRPST
jgi:hypothetical protein